MTLGGRTEKGMDQGTLQKSRKEAVLPKKKRAKLLLRLFGTHHHSNSNHNCLLQ
jgi:hypothetical protein